MDEAEIMSHLAGMDIEVAKKMAREFAQREEALADLLEAKFNGIEEFPLDEHSTLKINVVGHFTEARILTKTPSHTSAVGLTRAGIEQIRQGHPEYVSPARKLGLDSDMTIDSNDGRQINEMETYYVDQSGKFLKTYSDPNKNTAEGFPQRRPLKVNPGDFEKVDIILGSLEQAVQRFLPPSQN